MRWGKKGHFKYKTNGTQRNNKDNKEQKLGQHDLLWKLGMQEGTQLRYNNGHGGPL